MTQYLPRPVPVFEDGYDPSRPEFRYVKDGEYTGERCPECDSELYLSRSRRGKRQRLVCHCGWETETTVWVAQMRQSEAQWGQSPRSLRWPTVPPDVEEEW